MHKNIAAAVCAVSNIGWEIDKELVNDLEFQVNGDKAPTAEHAALYLVASLIENDEMSDAVSLEVGFWTEQPDAVAVAENIMKQL